MDLKIAVSPRGYDDIGAVIRKLEYKFTQLDNKALCNAKKLEPYDVVFINCSSSCESNAGHAASALNRYVHQGGTIYLSDYAADYVAAAFPDIVQFAGKTGKKGKTHAELVDKGLRGLIGNSIPLNFDLSGWYQIKSVGNEVRIYLQSDKMPLLVSFNFGKGQVIYTCFHNHAQVSEKEAELLRYLVLKPLMASASAEIADFENLGRRDLQETIDTVPQGGSSQWYEYRLNTAGPLTAVLNWKGEALLRLELEGGGSTWQQEDGTAPLTIQLPSAPSGRYRYRVVARATPLTNFPFVVVIGPSDQVKVTARTSGTAPTFDWNRTSAMQPIEPDLLDSVQILTNKPKDDPELDIRILGE